MDKMSSYFRRFILLGLCAIVGIALESCGRKQVYTDYEHPGPPVIMVSFVPLDGISENEAKRLRDEFYKNFAETQWEPYVVNKLGHKTTPSSCLNDSKSRFRGEKVIRWLGSEYKDISKSAKDNYGEDCCLYLIGVTDKDLSTSVHDKKDYGILGLSFLGKGNASIISTYRLKRRKDLWKLAVHEFCHGFYGCNHCKENNPNCIMADAKGGNPHFETKDSLCNYCKAICLIGD